MELNWTIRGEEKFQAFIASNATIGYEEALAALKEQYLANEKANAFTLAAENSKTGAETKKNYMGIGMDYDAQGTQLGGGKAYLDGDKEVARKDITIVFM